MVIAMSPALELRWRAGMRAKYGSLFQFVGNDILKVMDFPNLTVQGLNSMTGRTKIFASPKSNLILALNVPNGPMVEFFQSKMRQIEIATDHWRGYGIADPRYFYHNDLENS
jgi:hypothetical protein